jgi:uncharacterized membrane protein YkvA (DUF1232 family)
MFERFKILPQIWRTGRLVLRLVRDPRVPMTAKLIVGATLVYLLSPIDLVPDWFPVVGQADDLVALMAGLNLFLRACPRWLVEEHEDAIDGRSRQPRSDERLYESRRGPAGQTVDAHYERVH